MATQFTLYDSTQTSAPVLTAASGSLIGVLDACLVSGFGSMSPAGWSKPFSTAVKAVYRQGASGFYLRIVDDALATTLSGAGRDATFRGYETMSDVDTGTNSFPTSGQYTDSANSVRKSNTNDATARPWWIYADSRTFYMFVQSGDSGTLALGMGFGDIYSYVIADQYKCICMGRGTSVSGSVTLAGGFDMVSWGIALSNAIQPCAIARKAIGTGGSEQITKIVTNQCNAATNQGSPVGSIVYPNTADSKLWMSRIYVVDVTNQTLRGYLRGIYAPNHAASNFVVGDTFSGTGAMAGRSFKFTQRTFAGSSGGGQGIYIIETSNTVDVSS